MFSVGICVQHFFLKCQYFKEKFYILFYDFNNWTTTPKEIHSENVAPRISTNFIQCIVGRSVKDYTPVRLIAIGLALDTNPKGSGGVNVLY